MQAVGRCLLKVGSVSGWAELSFLMLTAAFWSVTGDLKLLCVEHKFLMLRALRCGWLCVCARGRLGTGSHPQPLSCVAGAILEVPLAPGLAGGGGFPRNLSPSFPWCASLCHGGIWVQDRASCRDLGLDEPCLGLGAALHSVHQPGRVAADSSSSTKAHPSPLAALANPTWAWASCSGRVWELPCRLRERLIPLTCFKGGGQVVFLPLSPSLL